MGLSMYGSPHPALKPAVSADSIASAGRLPQPVHGIIREIDRAIRHIARTAAGREKLCEYIVRRDIIKILVYFFETVERSGEFSELPALCDLMQAIRKSHGPVHRVFFNPPCLVMMDDKSIHEYILQDDIYTGAIAILKCMHLTILPISDQLLIASPNA